MELTAKELEYRGFLEAIYSADALVAALRIHIDRGSVKSVSDVRDLFIMMSSGYARQVASFGVVPRFVIPA